MRAPRLASKMRSRVFRTTQEHYCSATRRVVAPCQGNVLKKNGRSLGRVVRWGVYACTTLFVMLWGLSTWSPFTLDITHVSSDSKPYVHEFVFIFQDSRICIVYFPYWTHGGDAEPGWRLIAHRHGVSGGLRDEWWVPPHFRGSFGSGQWNIEFPLVYTALASLVFTGWLTIRSRPRQGECACCGYSLERLASNISPECGVERG